ncbi:MAG: endolytic transglycosylase MltG [Desulfobacteraceae bacterium]|nr:MAG: endolytic transglycosylase MltG [Desulfobacteraceae bacterium]
MSKFIKILLVILAALVITLSCFIFDIMNYAGAPAGRDDVTKFVVIEKGQSFNATLDALAKAGVITNPLKFKLFARIKGYDKKIHAGEYALSPVMPPALILDTMLRGKVYLHKITVPEGYNMQQVAEVISGAGFGTVENLMKITTDPVFLQEKRIHAGTLEGYLYPNTYYFPKDEPCENIISAMVEKFQSVFSPEWEKRAKELGFSIHEIITLASIIEKETASQDERRIISSVFHNRLKKGMRLETDPTVIYGIKNYKGNITRKHLSDRTPYNTYKIPGLPPGPIAGPGYESIKAALYPAETDYLFFVSKNDGTHIFSADFKEHGRAVRKYQVKK